MEEKNVQDFREDEFDEFDEEFDEETSVTCPATKQNFLVRGINKVKAVTDKIPKPVKTVVKVVTLVGAGVVIGKVASGKTVTTSFEEISPNEDETPDDSDFEHDELEELE